MFQMVPVIQVMTLQDQVRNIQKVPFWEYKQYSYGTNGTCYSSNDCTKLGKEIYNKYPFGGTNSTIKVQMVHAIQVMTAQDQVRKYTISTLLWVQIVQLWYICNMLLKQQLYKIR